MALMKERISFDRQYTQLDSLIGPNVMLSFQVWYKTSTIV